MVNWGELSTGKFTAMENSHEIMNTTPRKIPPVLVLASVMLIGATAALAEPRIDTELRNLRALSWDFAAWCEAENLIFKSKSSARFRISKAALCAGKPDGHVVCAPGSAPGADRGPARTPPCSDVSAPGA